MSSDSDDVVSRHHDEDWDRKSNEELRKLNQKIERAGLDSSLLNAKIANKKESLRSDAEEGIHEERNELLDLFARCPGFGPLENDPKILAIGLFGLKSRWYKRFLDIPLGCRGSGKQLEQLEEEIQWFRKLLELQVSFPDEDPLDRVKERLLRKPTDWDQFDFSHLTRKTAGELKYCLSRIETRLFIIRTTNDDFML